MDQKGYVHILIIPVIILAVGAFILLSVNENDVRVSRAPNESPTTLISEQPTASNEIPTLRYNGSVIGCGNAQLGAFNKSDTEAFAVLIDEEKLDITSESQTFNIAELGTPFVSIWNNDFNLKKTGGVHLETYRGENVSRNHCNDEIIPGHTLPDMGWVAREGLITVRKSDNLIDVLLKDVRLHNSENQSESVFLDEFRFNQVLVGWLPG